MKPFPTLATVASAFFIGVQSNAKAPDDRTNIQGVWLAQRESLNGKSKQVNFRYVFKGDKVTFTDETGREEKYTFKLDPMSKPKLCLIWPIGSDKKSKPVAVGYRLNGNSLTLIVAPEGKRPRDISDKYDQELIVCARSRS